MQEFHFNIQHGDFTAKRPLKKIVASTGTPPVQDPDPEE